MRKDNIGKRCLAYICSALLTGSLFFQSVSCVNVAAASRQVDKEEMVYVLTDGEGKINKIIVNDELKNESGAAAIEDKTDLKDIENVKGDETYTEHGENITWNADGKEITYQGKSEKALPVDVSISYKLDGKKIDAKSLAGKSGKVTIRFDYKNNEKRTVTVNGKKYKVYVPFTMVSGMILDSEKFSNVEVSNGKAIKQGDTTIVFGYATPGMKQSLGIGSDIFKDSKGEIDFPEYVEVTADVKDFELSMTLTAVTNDLLSDIDLDDKENADIDKDIDEMKDASKKLKDGADQLDQGAQSAADGSSTLADGMGQLADGLGTLSDGVDDYTDGVRALKEGAPILVDGMKQLDTGAKTLYQGNKELEEGIIAYVDGSQTLSKGLVGEGSPENPGYLAGVSQLQEGVKKLSQLKNLGELNTAIIQMKMATSDGGSIGSESGVTLGAASATLHSGLQTLQSQLQGMNDGLTEGKLKELAGALGTSVGIMESAQTKINEKNTSINEVVGIAEGRIQDAADMINTEAEHIASAKEQIETAKGELESGLENANAMIDENNSAIKESVQETNSNIDSAVSETNDEISTVVGEAKSLLENVKASAPEEAQESIQALIDELYTPSASGVHAEAAGTIEQINVETSMELPEINSADISKEAKRVALTTDALSAIDLSEEMGTIDAAAKALSDASGSIGDNPFGEIKSAVDQLVLLSGGVHNGVQQLNTTLGVISEKTSSLPDISKAIEVLNAGFEKLTAHNAAMEAGAKQLIDQGDLLKQGAAKLTAGSKDLADGTDTLMKGADKFVTGITTLDDNSSKLKSGAKSAVSGADKLVAGSEKLADGLGELADGTTEFREGIQEFDEKGIQKIIDLYEGDIKGLEDKFKAIQKAGKQYQTYTALADGSKGTVKFVYKSEEIKKEE